ncbi:hypothetical protein BMF94_0963 [Rhodotorula taiwanensis]|uniref:Nascent polypeptide-associated complex subunit beta n=1 Tax=Rhodotorula taiwanensis TaxID=741276 RepID=A0A2S5BGI2_9BASI|nr:hypothetical protein BMF94_0963 [Rhodotorula taiwanensis]
MSGIDAAKLKALQDRAAALKLDSSTAAHQAAQRRLDASWPQAVTVRARIRAAVLGWLTHLTLSLRHAPGGAKAPIRRKVAPKQPSAQDDKKLQTALKKLNVQGVGAVEEVNMFMDDGKVLNFNRPTVHAAAGSNTYAVYGHGVAKEITELMPGIIQQLGPDTMASLQKLAEQYSRGQQGPDGAAGIAEADEEDDDADDIPELVEADGEGAAEGAKIENLDDVN